MDTVATLREAIRTHVAGLDGSIWKEWLRELRENIYHNVEMVEEREEGEGPCLHDE